MRAAIDEYFDVVTGSGCPKHSSAIQCATSHVRQYLVRFGGALFDPRRDEPWWDANVIVPSDLTSVAMLSMSRFASASFLRAVVPEFDSDQEDALRHGFPTSCRDHIHCLLRQVGPTSSIFGMSSRIDLDRMNDIWGLIRGNTVLVKSRGFDFAGISKLMSRKRPALVPILDTVARSRISRANGGLVPVCHWCYLRNEFTTSTTLIPAVARIRSRSKVPDWFSDLRLIDIVVWMADSYGC
jgi:hypothetical protein